MARSQFLEMVLGDGAVLNSLVQCGELVEALKRASSEDRKSYEHLLEINLDFLTVRLPQYRLADLRGQLEEARRDEKVPKKARRD